MKGKLAVANCSLLLKPQRKDHSPFSMLKLPTAKCIK